MKTTSAMMIATALLSSVLTACGTSAMNAQDFPTPMRVPQMTQNLQTQNFQAAYYNLILKTGYQPDGGTHFGFDFANVTYINRAGKTLNFNLRYSPQGRILWVHLAEQGAPLDQAEHIKQEDTARLLELARELRKLGAGTAQDKTNVNRIATLLEHPPVRP